MSATTDPIKEFARTCERLRGRNNTSVGLHLASSFGVQFGETNFYRILTIISDRIDLINEIIKKIDLDDDLRQEALQHTNGISQLFNPRHINDPWNQISDDTLSDLNIRPIKMLSMQARELIRYPELSKEEIKDIKDLSENLLSWLNDHQLAEYDFIREAIIRGLREFLFSIEKLEWVGRPHTLRSLQSIVSAYIAMENGAATLADKDPLISAAAKKTKELIFAANEKLTGIKKTYDNGKFALEVYGLTQLGINYLPAIKALISPS